MELQTLDEWLAPRWVSSPPESTAFAQKVLRAFLDGHLCVPAECDLPPPFVRDGNRMYVQKAWVLETLVLRELKRLEKQLTVITGGPGTGKTYTAGRLVREWNPKRLIAAAPTGKAAARLAEAIGGEATTLHRLLRVSPAQERIVRDERLEADLIVVDEASMIDAALLAQLLQMVPDGARLVLLGDADQLPPVEGGSLFRELAELFGTRLEKVMRTDSTELLELAQAVRDGKKGALSLHPLEEISPRLLYGSGEMPSPEELLKSLGKYALLSCLRQGPWGVDALNQRALARLEKTLKKGDWWAIPLMIVQNEPRLDLYNGMMGIRVGRFRGGKIARSEGTAYVGGQVWAAALLPLFEEGFALSVHKSQGSEFDEVDLLVPEGSERFGREALYTGITRARKKIKLWGNRETAELMIGRRFETTSGLSERLKRGGTSSELLCSL